VLGAEDAGQLLATGKALCADIKSQTHLKLEGAETLRVQNGDSLNLGWKSKMALSMTIPRKRLIKMEANQVCTDFNITFKGAKLYFPLWNLIQSKIKII